MEKQIPVLFEKKTDCAACGACLNACPAKAISFQEDECGYLYPTINKDLCVRCGKCKTVCHFQNHSVKNTPLTTYAAVCTDPEILHRSASGGIFAALAGRTVLDGGIVFGAAMQSDFSVSHIMADNAGDLKKLQGSKYTQSFVGDSFIKAKKALESGKKVLFSGTPCQIDGLYGYLGKDYENLTTVDVICHGVPNNRMFREYLQVLGEKLGGTVESFSFRDKDIGWGINASARIEGQDKKQKVWNSTSSYLYYFQRGSIYRENCYNCPYACQNRVADITLGDYWGIEKQHPEYLGKQGFSEKNGISVVIVNTEKGRNLIDHCENIEKRISSFEKTAAANGQLRHPSNPGKREELLALYLEKEHWSALDERFRKNIGWHYYSSQIKALLPSGVKKALKRMR